MFTTQIQLSDEKLAALRDLSQQTGKSEKELIASAVEQMLQTASKAHRLVHLQQAKGIWRDHETISAERVRKEWDRS